MSVSSQQSAEMDYSQLSTDFISSNHFHEHQDYIMPLPEYSTVPFRDHPRSFSDRNFNLGRSELRSTYGTAFSSETYGQGAVIDAPTEHLSASATSDLCSGQYVYGNRLRSGSQEPSGANWSPDEALLLSTRREIVSTPPFAELMSMNSDMGLGILLPSLSPTYIHQTHTARLHPTMGRSLSPSGGEFSAFGRASRTASVVGNMLPTMLYGKDSYSTDQHSHHMVEEILGERQSPAQGPFLQSSISNEQHPQLTVHARLRPISSPPSARSQQYQTPAKHTRPSLSTEHYQMEAEEGVFKCSCGKLFKGKRKCAKSNMKRHIQSMTTNHSCDKCHRVFSGRKDNLRSHQRTCLL